MPILLFEQIQPYFHFTNMIEHGLGGEIGIATLNGVEDALMGLNDLGGKSLAGIFTFTGTCIPVLRKTCPYGLPKISPKKVKMLDVGV